MVVPPPLFYFYFSLNLYWPHVVANLLGKTDFPPQQRYMACCSQGFWKGDPIRTLEQPYWCIFNWRFPMELLQGKVLSTWAHSKAVILFFLVHWLFSKGAPWCSFVSRWWEGIDVPVSDVGAETGSVPVGIRAVLGGSCPYTLWVPAQGVHVLLLHTCR